MLLANHNIGVLGTVDLPMLEAGIAEGRCKLLCQLAGLFQMVVALAHTATGAFQCLTVAQILGNVGGFLQNGATEP